MGPFDWLASHLEILKWMTVVGILWKSGKLVARIEDRAVNAETLITKMATNDLVHIQGSLENIERTNNSIDSSLKTMVYRTRRAIPKIKIMPKRARKS